MRYASFLVLQLALASFGGALVVLIERRLAKARMPSRMRDALCCLAGGSIGVAFVHLLANLPAGPSAFPPPDGADSFSHASSTVGSLGGTFVPLVDALTVLLVVAVAMVVCLRGSRRSFGSERPPGGRSLRVYVDSEFRGVVTTAEYDAVVSLIRADRSFWLGYLGDGLLVVARLAAAAVGGVVWLAACYAILVPSLCAYLDPESTLAFVRAGGGLPTPEALSAGVASAARALLVQSAVFVILRQAYGANPLRVRSRMARLLMPYLSAVSAGGGADQDALDAGPFGSVWIRSR